MLRAIALPISRHLKDNDFYTKHAVSFAPHLKNIHKPRRIRGNGSDRKRGRDGGPGFDRWALTIVRNLMIDRYFQSNSSPRMNGFHWGKRFTPTLSACSPRANDGYLLPKRKSYGHLSLQRHYPTCAGQSAHGPWF